MPAEILVLSCSAACLCAFWMGASSADKGVISSSWVVYGYAGAFWAGQHLMIFMSNPSHMLQGISIMRSCTAAM